MIRVQEFSMHKWDFNFVIEGWRLGNLIRMVHELVHYLSFEQKVLSLCWLTWTEGLLSLKKMVERCCG